MCEEVCLERGHARASPRRRCCQANQRRHATVDTHAHVCPVQRRNVAVGLIDHHRRVVSVKRPGPPGRKQLGVSPRGVGPPQRVVSHVARPDHRPRNVSCVPGPRVAVRCCFADPSTPLGIFSGASNSVPCQESKTRVRGERHRHGCVLTEMLAFGESTVHGLPRGGAWRAELEVVCLELDRHHPALGCERAVEVRRARPLNRARISSHQLAFADNLPGEQRGSCTRSESRCFLQRLVTLKLPTRDPTFAASTGCPLSKVAPPQASHARAVFAL